MWTTPNILTVLRLIAAPAVAVMFLYFNRPYADWFALLLFVGAAITDWFDGFLARAWSQETKLGSMLDPIADKAMVVIALMVIVGYSSMSPWLVLPATVIMFREVFISGLRELLWVSDKRKQQKRELSDWTMRHALILGCWQMLALIPGTSRSGITITGARFLNYDRASAIKISMLMSIPTIIAAAALEFYSIGIENISVNWAELVVAIVVSALAAFGALSLMMRLLKTVNFTPYVLYRMLLGSFLIIWALV